MKVGDYVTWRSGGPNTLGIRGCKIVKFGKGENGEDAALIDIGRFAEKEGEPIGVLLAHLHSEE